VLLPDTDDINKTDSELFFVIQGDTVLQKTCAPHRIHRRVPRIENPCLHF
jgi:hypothetical protein